MAEDARAEAERIVTELKNEATFRSYGVWDSREVHDRVVAALAAAINLRDQCVWDRPNGLDCRQAGHEPLCPICEVLARLAELGVSMEGEHG